MCCNAYACVWAPSCLSATRLVQPPDEPPHDDTSREWRWPSNDAATNSVTFGIMRTSWLAYCDTRIIFVPINQIFNAYSLTTCIGTVDVSKIVCIYLIANFFKKYSKRNNCQYSLLIPSHKLSYWIKLFILDRSHDGSFDPFETHRYSRFYSFSTSIIK